MKSKTTIEVNGRRYDAVTGAVIGAASAPPVRTGRNIDGFFRSRTTPIKTSVVKTPPVSDHIAVSAAPAPSHRPKPQPNRGVNHARAHTPQPAKTAEIRVHSAAQHSQKLTVHHPHTAPNHTKAHTLQHSQTLMRTAVQRPAPSFHKQVATKAALQHSVPSLIVPKKSVASLDAGRLARAQTTSRSPLVAHHASQVHSIQPTFTTLSVQPTPSKAPEAMPPPPMPTNKPTDIFEHALANATGFIDTKAHHAHFKKKARAHVASMAAGTLALLVIAGFAAYQNTPGLQLRVAGMRAGIATSMPNFKAAGFAYNGVKAGDGKVTVGFSGASGNYQLTQQATNLSSSEMIQNIGYTDASGIPDYTVVRAGNTPVYRFSNTAATWVKSGQWYQVNGTGNLTDQQLKTLAQNV